MRNHSRCKFIEILLKKFLLQLIRQVEGYNTPGYTNIFLDLVFDPHQIKISTVEGPVLFRSVACGKGHTMAISNKGELWGWGMSQMVGGKNGLTQNIPLTKPELVNHLTGRRVLQVRTGFSPNISP